MAYVNEFSTNKFKIKTLNTVLIILLFVIRKFVSFKVETEEMNECFLTRKFTVFIANLID